MDSGEIKDPDIGGGKLGLMSFSQENVIWSAVSARCLGKCLMRIIPSPTPLTLLPPPPAEAASVAGLKTNDHE